MTKILTIALNTYKEAIRNKVFYIIAIFALVLLSFSLILATLALGEDDRIIKHVGLSAISIFGLLMATFVGVNLVYEELEKRTIYTIIASGVTRYQFLLGKFLGLFMTVVANVLIMGALLFLLVVLWPNSGLSATLVMALYLFLFENDDRLRDRHTLLLVFDAGAFGGADVYVLGHRPHVRRFAGMGQTPDRTGRNRFWPAF